MRHILSSRVRLQDAWLQLVDLDLRWDASEHSEGVVVINAKRGERVGPSIGSPARNEPSNLSASAHAGFCVSRLMLGYAHWLPLRRRSLVEEIHRIIENKPAWDCEMVREILDGKGITVSRNRMHRLRKAEKLQVTRLKTRRKFLTGARLNPEPTEPNSVWCAGFAENKAGGRKVFVYRVKDEATGFCLTSKARSSWKGVDVRDELDRWVAIHGLPGTIRTDNRVQYISRAAVGWAAKHRIAQAFIVSIRPWQNSAAECLFDMLRRECLDVELFATLEVGQIRLERWRRTYNEERPNRWAGGAACISLSRCRKGRGMRGG